MWAGEGDADAIIEKRGLKQISDAGAIEKLVDEVLATNAKQVEDYRAGKEKAFNSLVGQVMKATQGKANPAQVNEILRKKLPLATSRCCGRLASLASVALVLVVARVDADRFLLLRVEQRLLRLEVDPRRW